MCDKECPEEMEGTAVWLCSVVIQDGETHTLKGEN